MKDSTVLQALIPNGSVLVHEEGEADFAAPAWLHIPTGIYGITPSGHLDNQFDADEADRVTAWAKALRFVEAVRPSRFLWDLTSLRSIGTSGLKMLKEFHRGLSPYAACAMVQNRNSKQPAEITTLLADCYMAASVPDAIAWLEMRKNGTG